MRKLSSTLGTRTRKVVALVLAVAGVAVLSDVRLVAAPLGFVSPAVNAVLFAFYIVLGHRVAQSPAVRGIDGLALAMLIAAVIALPLGVGQAASAFGDPVALAASLGVGVTSSVIPYVCVQLAMARLTRAAYALMVALLPATATVIGVLVLRHSRRSSRSSGWGSSSPESGCTAKVSAPHRVAQAHRAPRVRLAARDKQTPGPHMAGPAFEVSGVNTC